MRNLTGGRSSLDVAGTTVGQVLDEVEERFPGFRARVLDPDGAIKGFIIIMVNDVEARGTGGLQVKVPPDSEIHIVPAIGGGR